MALLTKLSKNIEAAVLEFTERLADKYNLPQEDLVNLWTDITKMKTKTLGAKKVKSSYQMFANDQRVLLKKENPGMTFGAISAEIGRRWRLLSKEQQIQYKSSEIVPLTAVTAENTELPPESKKNKLLKLSKSELLEMCDTHGIKGMKSKSKVVIVEAICQTMNDDPVEDNSGSSDEFSSPEM
jgi:hypothetical protein